MAERKESEKKNYLRKEIIQTVRTMQPSTSGSDKSKEASSIYRERWWSYDAFNDHIGKKERESLQ